MRSARDRHSRPRHDDPRCRHNTPPSSRPVPTYRTGFPAAVSPIDMALPAATAGGWRAAAAVERRSPPNAGQTFPYVRPFR